MRLFFAVKCGKIVGRKECGNMEETISFARKYRTNSLDGYVGNKDVKDTVLNYLKRGRPQSFLLHGSSGCGKTTLARVIAKIYCCEDWSEETGPCGICQSCQSFDEYIRTGDGEMLPDLYEIDSSDKSGKKDIDVLLSSMEYPAVSGDWKVYIIDEAHLLSQGAMGRLLKTLEEPPEGVLIILCTTNPEDLLDTIKNRCQVKLPVSKPTTSEIINLLQRVCLSEDKNYDLTGLRNIVIRSDNVVRDSLNNLERVLNTRGDATGVSVSIEFQQVSDRMVLDFYEAYYNEDIMSYINILYRVKTSYGFDPFLKSMLSLTVRGIYVLNSVDVEGLTQEELKTYLDLFSKFSPKELSVLLTKLSKLRDGDVEINLMSLIYSKGMVDEVELKTPIVIHESKEELIKEETSMRNNNMETIQKGMLSAGISSLADEVSTVSIADVESLFSIEKIE